MTGICLRSNHAYEEVSAAKPLEREEARRLRVDGMPMKQIAATLGVSVSSVSLWTRDIELTNEQRARNLRRAGQARGDAWRDLNRRKRQQQQSEGRARARKRDPLHVAGCMLYWAEGSKGRNTAALTNSDLQLVRLFRRFLVDCMGVSRSEITLRLNVYLRPNRSLREIETYWLQGLGLTRDCLRGHTINNLPTSSSGRKVDSLPYGVCTLRVLRSTKLVQHIYGAIQEYGGFEEPRWVNGLY
jgi:hypothetical protein